MDTYNRLHGELGLDPVDAVLRTAAQRLRPIFLTTFTTMMGLIPMATQVTVNFLSREIEIGGVTSTWWVQLSTAIVFGLGFSTLLTLVLVPVLLAAPNVYGQMFTTSVGWARSRFAGRHARATREGEAGKTATKKRRKSRKPANEPGEPPATMPQAAE
jgi:multidrug efflux pump